MTVTANNRLCFHLGWILIVAALLGGGWAWYRMSVAERHVATHRDVTNRLNEEKRLYNERLASGRLTRFDGQPSHATAGYAPFGDSEGELVNARLLFWYATPSAVFSLLVGIVLFGRGWYLSRRLDRLNRTLKRYGENPKSQD